MNEEGLEFFKFLSLFFLTNQKATLISVRRKGSTKHDKFGVSLLNTKI